MLEGEGRFDKAGSDLSIDKYDSNDVPVEKQILPTKRYGTGRQIPLSGASPSPQLRRSLRFAGAFIEME